LYLKYYNLLKRLQQGSPTRYSRAPGRPQGPNRSPAGIGVARGSILAKALAFFVVLCFERRCLKQNNAARLKSKYLVPTKISVGYATTRGPVLKTTLA